MKRYNILGFVFAVVAVAGCDEFENSAEKSKVTILPQMTVHGDSEVELACNASGFTDPGASAVEGPNEIEVETTLTGEYFGGSLVGGEWQYSDNTTVDGPDVYEFYYRAENKDGIPAAAFRYVSVPACNGDLITSIAGVYKSSIVRTLTEDGAAAGSYTDLSPIMIKDLGNDMYQLSDALGGWYDHGRAFGYTGSAPGMTVTVNNIATNDFSFGEGVMDQTFGEVVTITDFAVNPVTKTITWTAEWTAGYTFEVTLTQI